MASKIDRRRGVLDDIPADAASAMDEWADWVRQFRDLPAGAVSPAYRMMQAKLLGVAAHGTRLEPEMPGHIAAVDHAVGHLPTKLKRAFRTYYLVYAPTEAKASRCRCDVTTFYRRLRKARRIVANSIRTERITA